MDTPEKVEVVQVAPKKKPVNKVLIFSLIGVFVACICCTIVIVIAYLVINGAVNSKDYIQKTESNYDKVKTKLASVEDSIANEYSVDATGDTYIDIKGKVDTAYTLATELETLVTDAEKSIPTSNNDTKLLDTELRDYYKSTKELAISYKDLLSVHKNTLPVVKAIEDLGTAFSSFENLTTPEDYDDFATQLKAQRVILKEQESNLTNVKTTKDTEFVKVSMKLILTSSIDFIDAFITFTEKSVVALQDGTLAFQDEVAMASASEDLTTAGQDYTDSISTSTYTTDKETFISSLESKLEKISEKQDLTDADLAKVKATIK